MLVPNRTGGNDDYRYGYNGHEKDDEVKGSGNHYDFGNYGLDTRIGRRFQPDPRWKELPGQSPYSVNNNNPVQFKDPDGEFGIIGALVGAVVGAGVEIASQAILNVADGKPALSKIDWVDVVISSAEGALIGATGGAGSIAIGATGGFLKASIDNHNDGKGFKTINNGRKTKKQFGKDLVNEAVGLGVGEVIPPLGKWASKQIGKEATTLEGKIEEEISAQIIDSTIGTALKKGAVNLVDKATEVIGDVMPKTEETPTINIMLPELEISVKKGAGTNNNKITEKGKNKLKKHVKKNVAKKKK